MIKTISNEDLKLGDIPPDDSDWGTIAEFALTYNGYEIHGSFEKCAEIANNRRNETLIDLRTCLFFEQRRWRHFDEVPTEEAMRYIQGLLGKIRTKVASGNRN